MSNNDLSRISNAYGLLISGDLLVNLGSFCRFIHMNRPICKASHPATVTLTSVDTKNISTRNTICSVFMVPPPYFNPPPASRGLLLLVLFLAAQHLRAALFLPICRLFLCQFVRRLQRSCKLNPSPLSNESLHLSSVPSFDLT